MTDKQDVILKIESAFADTPYPGDDRIGWSHEAESIRELFQGMHWRTLPVSFIYEHRVDLMYFTDDGFRFFLPAFMLALLNHPDDVDRLSLNLLLRLCPPNAFPGQLSPDSIRSLSEKFLIRASVFTHEEIAAIIAFLELYEQLFADEHQVSGLGLPESAILFWKTRLHSN